MNEKEEKLKSRLTGLLDLEESEVLIKSVFDKKSNSDIAKEMGQTPQWVFIKRRQAIDTLRAKGLDVLG